MKLAYRMCSFYPELLDELKDLFTRCEESRYAGGGSLDGATACRRARELVRKLESLKLKA